MTDQQQQTVSPPTRTELLDRMTAALDGRQDLAGRIVRELLDDHDDGRALAVDLLDALEAPERARRERTAALVDERFRTRTTTVEGLTRDMDGRGSE